MPRKKTTTPNPVGKRIRKARLDRHLTLDNLANQTGLSVAYLKKIEDSDKIPPVGTLLQISRALQIDSGLLFKEEQGSERQRIREYAKRTDDYAYTTLTPGAENKHLKAFRVTIDPKSTHRGVGYQHEGEEFVYVLEGEVEVTVGEHVNQLRKEDSLHFNSGVSHKLRNVGEATAVLIVVIYNP